MVGLPAYCTLCLNITEMTSGFIYIYSFDSSWREHSLPYMAPLFAISGQVPAHKLCTQLHYAIVSECNADRLLLPLYINASTEPTVPKMLFILYTGMWCPLSNSRLATILALMVVITCSLATGSVHPRIRK